MGTPCRIQLSVRRPDVKPLRQNYIKCHLNIGLIASWCTLLVYQHITHMYNEVMWTSEYSYLIWSKTWTPMQVIIMQFCITLRLFVHARNWKPCGNVCKDSIHFSLQNSRLEGSRFSRGTHLLLVFWWYEVESGGSFGRKWVPVTHAEWRYWALYNVENRNNKRGCTKCRWFPSEALRF